MTSMWMMPVPTVLATWSADEKNSGQKLKKAAQYDGVLGGQHPGGDNRGDRVGGIVKAVDEVEGQSDDNDEDDKQQGTIHVSGRFLR